MTGINVVARIESFTGSMNVCATASHSTGELNQTFLHIGGIEKDDWIKLCFTATGITRVFHTMYNCITLPNRKIVMYISEVGHLSGKIIKTFVSASHKAGRKLHIVAWVHLVQDLKLKLVSRAVNSKIAKLLNLKSAIGDPDIETIGKMKAEIAVPEIPRTGILSVRTMRTKVDKTFKMSIKLMGLALKGIMSHIRYGLTLQKMEQNLELHAESTNYETTIRSSITTEVQQADTKLSLVMEIKNWCTSKFQMMVNTSWNKIKSLFQVVIMDGHRNSTITMDTSTMNLERKLDLSAKLEGFSGKLMLLAHVEEVRDQILDIQAYLISVLGETSLRFRPQALPQIRQLNVMISVCETWVLSYLSFIPTEAFKGVEVHVSTCSHLVRSILQWYLTGGRISNQGYGNEIIFDLGKVDPQGPIPPVPSQKWEGGYVEDPFKGVGYVPADDTTGYASPKVADWLGNVKMYWNDASQPFEGGK